MKIARETAVIMVIGIIDLATTIVLIRHQGAQEANPLFQHYWRMGVVAFITAKLVLLTAPLFILEWARKHRPVFVAMSMRAIIVAYVALYGIGFARLNGRGASAEEMTSMRPLTAGQFQALYHLKGEHPWGSRIRYPVPPMAVN